MGNESMLQASWFVDHGLEDFGTPSTGPRPAKETFGRRAGACAGAAQALLLFELSFRQADARSLE